MAARAAVRMWEEPPLPYNDVDKVAKMIPMMPGKHITIESAISQSELKALYSKDNVMKELDMAKSAACHAMHPPCSRRGYFSRPITDLVPLYRNET